MWVCKHFITGGGVVVGSVDLPASIYCDSSLTHHRFAVIDFGGATYDWEGKSSVINTRQYRAPEVVLGLSWSLESDVWSLGCILMELYTGELLFQTVSSLENQALVLCFFFQSVKWG